MLHFPISNHTFKSMIQCKCIQMYRETFVGLTNLANGSIYNIKPTLISEKAIYTKVLSLNSYLPPTLSSIIVLQHSYINSYTYPLPPTLHA